jgi:predicted SprT family Zn-dependent metalloprotease
MSNVLLVIVCSFRKGVEEMNANEIEKWGEEIDRWIWEACRDNECPGLADWIKWQWRRMACSMGVARPLMYFIRFSLPLWEVADEWNRRNTAKHEACHIIARWKAKEPIRAHGKEWRQAMTRAGEMAQVRHSIPTPPRVLVPVKCGCPERKISKHIAGRIRNGKPYRCSVCDQRIALIR